MSTNPDMAALRPRLDEIRSLVSNFLKNAAGTVQNLSDARELQHDDLVERVGSGAMPLKEAHGVEARIRNPIGHAHLDLRDAFDAQLIDADEYSHLRVGLNDIADALDAKHPVDPGHWSRELETAASELQAAIA